MVAVLLAAQRAAKFDAFSGATAALVVPVSDRLISDVVSRQLPDAIRELDIEAQSGNQLTVALRLRKPAWLPRLTIKLAIDRQPRLPEAPVLVLRLLSHGALAALAGPAAKFLTVRAAMDRDRRRSWSVSISRSSCGNTKPPMLSAYIRRLNVTTREGSIVLTVDAGIS